MDPATLALAAAPLVAKAAEQLGQAVWDKVTAGTADKSWAVLGQVASRIREWFVGRNDVNGVKAVEDVAAAPTDQAAVQKLADTLKPGLEQDPKFSAELAALLEQAKRQPGVVGQFSVQVMDNAQIGKLVQIESMTANEIKLEF